MIVSHIIERAGWDYQQRPARRGPGTTGERNLIARQGRYRSELAVDDEIANEWTRLKADQAAADVWAEGKATVHVA